MDFSVLFPGLEDWIASLKTAFPASVIRAHAWAFPVIQTFHLLALSALGGAVLLANLRLMGAGMTSVPFARIERSVRPILIGALVVIVITGVLMASVVAAKLYNRPAYFVKMVALASALLLSLGVESSLARHDGAMTRPAQIMTAIAVALWLFAVWVFGTSMGAAPGTFHLVFAGWLVVMAFGSRMTRIILGSVTAVAVIAIGIVTYGVYHPMEDYDLVMEINRWAVRIAALAVAGLMVWEFGRPTPTRLLGAFTIVVWITVAASGRWIGLGGGV